jgi:transcription-repair coupling factor (superfamily II helicase)
MADFADASSRLFQPLWGSELLDRAACCCAEDSLVELTGVWGSAAALIAAALAQRTDRPVVFITPHLDDADAAVDDIETLTGQRAMGLPAWEAQLAGDHVSVEITGERLAVLNRMLACGQGGQEPPAGPMILVAPVMAMLQPVPSRETLAASRRTLAVGEELDLDELIGWLIDGGFEPVEQVEEPGQFAHRGGIFDLFAPGQAQPIRIELFGDEIDSLRHFDLDTQRSTEPCRQVSVMAAGLAGDDPSAVTTLLEYLPADTLICTLEADELRDLAGQLYDRVRDDLAEASSPVALRSPAELFDGFERFTRVEMRLFAGRRNRGLALGVRSLERLRINTDEALAELADLAGDNDVWVCCDNTAEADRFAAMLAERHASLAGRVRLVRGHLAEGFAWPAAGLVAVGHHEIYQRHARPRKIRRVRTGRPIESMLDLAEGDYVVHVARGIAKFEGLRKMDRDGASEEYLRLRFAEGAIVHVPVSEIHLVQKYIGSRGRRPNLSNIGGGHWARTKERVAEAVEDLAAEMLRLQAARRASPGVAYAADSELQRQFAEEFAYVETEDQLAAIRAVEADMARAEPMDRLICGDVGYGKTEVAMRAAMRVVEAGRQVAVLVPTTVLAEQHGRTFTERFADFPVVVEMLSRFRTAGEQKSILKRLAAGQVDILIGTHRMLSSDVRFAELGLVVIDEEQRFGVSAKDHLKSLRVQVEVLTLTATPIPRTLHMALLGLRDISSLATPPLDRRAIHTEVSPRDDSLIRSAILRELNRDGQVFFVHNRVQDIHAVEAHLRKLVPDARLAVGHGQMPERQLEAVMGRLAQREIDVLLCTTIIELGLDIPSANTMIIDEADRYGLSELHQLRGRVGRYKHRAYCYLLLPERRTLNPVAARRLKAIEDFSDLGSGFAIAMRDLEIRGAGNILGPQQSGHIAAVGYELYCQLLERSVRRMRGEPAPSRPDTHLDLDVDALLPRAWVASARQRMEAYRRLAEIATVADLQSFREDLRDAYGPLPASAETLLALAEVRLRCGPAGIVSGVWMQPDVIFALEEQGAGEALWEALRAGPGGTVRHADDRTAHWRPPVALRSPEKFLPALLAAMRAADN